MLTSAMTACVSDKSIFDDNISARHVTRTERHETPSSRDRFIEGSFKG